MNASYRWLLELAPPPAPLTPAALRDLLTERCCTVDELVPLRADLAGIVVGEVVEAGPHPNSDHLSLTRVDAGSGALFEVVCGAPNVRAGAKYPFAAVGTTLPGGLTLERRKIRGVVSNGMLCSARELALGSDHAGILELDTAAAPGTPLLEAISVGDTRLVLDVTPNRPDLLSHLGLAREIAAATGVALGGRVTATHSAPSAGERVVTGGAHARREQAGSITVELLDDIGCRRYAGALLRGIRVGPSPDWLVERLAAVGSRSVNNVVDATNYLLFELGQPMHAFDAAKLAGGLVRIRRARDGEHLVTLDGAVRTLDSGMTVIADDERAQAVAGVMGGAGSEVGEETTSVFLEVATFDPGSVRRTRRALGLSTDASYRFERGTDPELPPVALQRAIEMIRDLAGGELAGAPVDIDAHPHRPTLLELRPARVDRVLGEAIPPRDVERLLASVGFNITGGDRSDRAAGRGVPAGAWRVEVPSWRPDVTREIDLIEEVARLRGYDAASDELRPFRPGTVPDAPSALAARRIRSALVSAGLLEARPMPFVAGTEGVPLVRVANPLAEDEAYLRRTLLDTLARRTEHNLARMQRDVRMFEVGTVFAPAAEGAQGAAQDAGWPREELRAAALVMGHRRPPHWTEPAPPDYDEWDAKGLGERLAHAAFPGEVVELVRAGGDQGGAAAEWGEGTIWAIVAAGRSVGVVRRVTLDAPPWAAPAFGVEITLGAVSATPVAPPGSTAYGAAAMAAVAPAPGHRYRPLPATPAAEFDLALLVPDTLEAARVEELIRRESGELLEALTLFDQYRGSGVPPGSRSLAWRLTFRHPERTLREKEVAGRRERLLRTLEGELGVRPRTA